MIKVKGRVRTRTRSPGVRILNRRRVCHSHPSSHLQRGGHWKRAGAKLDLSGPHLEITEQIKLEKESLARAERDERASN